MEDSKVQSEDSMSSPESLEFLSSMMMAMGSTYASGISPLQGPLLLSTSPSSPFLANLASPAASQLLPLVASSSTTESPISSSISNSTTKDMQQVLTNGMRMFKIPNKASSRPAERLIRLELMPLQLSWESKKKKNGLLSTLDLHWVKEIRLGQNTKAFDLHGRSSDFEDRAFSIIYTNTEGEYKVLNLGNISTILGPPKIIF